MKTKKGCSVDRTCSLWSASISFIEDEGRL
jgi:hypothetical protein